MVDEQPRHHCRPEDYRNYLLCLARLWMPLRLQRMGDASDIVQAVLAKACAKAHQFKGDPGPQFKAWLREIVCNTVKDFVRKYGNSPEQSLRDIETSWSRLEQAIQADQSSPSERAMRDEQLERLANALAGLPEEQQEVLVRKHCLGCKVAEIAKDLGCTNASVAGLLRRGLARLRERLPEE